MIDIDQKNVAKIDNYYHFPFIVIVSAKTYDRNLKRRIQIEMNCFEMTIHYEHRRLS